MNQVHDIIYYFYILLSKIYVETLDEILTPCAVALISHFFMLVSDQNSPKAQICITQDHMYPTDLYIFSLKKCIFQIVYHFVKKDSTYTFDKNV